MSQATHTEDDFRERAAAYALGGLDRAEALAFEQHLDEGCDECAAELTAFNPVVEQMAWASAHMTPPFEVRAKLLARVALEPPPRASHARPLASEDEQEEKPFDGEVTLRMKRPDASRPSGHSSEAQPDDASSAPKLPPGVLAVRADEGVWRETADAGIFVKILFADAERGQYTTLVRMSPGSHMPRHRHKGTEQCLVLEGDISSGGVSASAGDFICALPGSVHEALSTTGGALLLLVSPESYEVLEPRA